MKRPKPPRAAAWVVLSLALLACRSVGEESPRGGEEPTVTPLLESLTLDLSRPSAEAPLALTLEELEVQKFVQVEIAEVINPKRLRIGFELHYRPAESERRLLGEFSLFPPDNPGEFLVATRGWLRPGGALELTLTPLDEIEPEDELTVEVRRIALRSQ